MPKKSAVAEKVTISDVNGKVEQLPSGDFFVTWDKDTGTLNAFNSWRGKEADPNDSKKFTFREDRLRGVRWDPDNVGWVVPIDYYAELREFATRHGFDVSEMPENVNPRLFGKLSNGDFYFRFPWSDDRELMNQLKSDVPGSHFDKGPYAWVAPARSQDAANQFAEDEGFETTSYVIQVDDDDDDDDI